MAELHHRMVMLVLAAAVLVVQALILITQQVLVVLEEQVFQVAYLEVQFFTLAAAEDTVIQQVLLEEVELAATAVKLTVAGLPV